MPPLEKVLKLSPLSSTSEESSSTNLKEKVDTTPKKKSIKKRSLPDDEGKGDECPQPKVIKADTSFLPDESPNIAVVPPLDRVASGITATTKKIGFIGLGMMGQLLVKWLLNSGHDVTIYNRTSEKCQSFVRTGAFVANTASDVVFTCDIIFCCVSGPAAVKDLVFGNNGILNGLEKSDGSPKGIVELSSIDPNTVEEVAEAITSKGGRYLHAALSGSRQLAEMASMVVLSSGNQELFSECESCFLSFSKKAYFLSQTICTGSKINLICNMFTGTITAALAEAVSLAETCKLPIRNFLDLVELSPISCPLVRNKVSAMYVKNFEPDNPLKHQQKDLQMAIQIGNTVSQPLALTAVAHELYKRAKRDYSDKDISAIYHSFK